MNTVIYFRSDQSTKEELEIAREYFCVVEHRNAVPDGSKVLCRYSSLPYMKELEEDLKLKNCTLVNTYSHHQFVADIQNWYEGDSSFCFKSDTFKTWFDVMHIPPEENGPFVIKGRTNSKKFKWDTHMFAASRKEVGQVIANLMEDPLISEQGICIRKYEPLVTYETSINGLPITHEFRVFAYKGEIISKGFYWSNFYEELKQKYDLCLNKDALDLVKQIAWEVQFHIPFVCIDIAMTTSGEWKVVELNDGTMAGLSTINPWNFYENLKNKLND